MEQSTSNVKNFATTKPSSHAMLSNNMEKKASIPAGLVLSRRVGVLWRKVVAFTLVLSFGRRIHYLSVTDFVAATTGLTGVNCQRELPFAMYHAV
jgi:hypothetical protein